MSRYTSSLTTRCRGGGKARSARRTIALQILPVGIVRKVEEISFVFGRMAVAKRSMSNASRERSRAPFPVTVHRRAVWSP